MAKRNTFQSYQKVFLCFQEAHKETSGMEWVNYLQKSVRIFYNILIEVLSKSICRKTPGLTVMRVSKVKIKDLQHWQNFSTSPKKTLKLLHILIKFINILQVNSFIMLDDTFCMIYRLYNRLYNSCIGNNYVFYERQKSGDFLSTA